MEIYFFLLLSFFSLQMSRIKQYAEHPPTKIQRTARKLIDAFVYVQKLEQAYACISHKVHDFNTEERFSHLLVEANDKMFELMQKLIDHSPWWAKREIKNEVMVEVRMNDGEIIHFMTWYDLHGYLGDVKIERYVK